MKTIEFACVCESVVDSSSLLRQTIRLVIDPTHHRHHHHQQQHQMLQQQELAATQLQDQSSPSWCQIEIVYDWNSLLFTATMSATKVETDWPGSRSALCVVEGLQSGMRRSLVAMELWNISLVRECKPLHASRNILDLAIIRAFRYIMASWK